MAVKIRLRRMGAKKKPFYRVVVADSRSPRDGRCIEEIGYFNPIAKPEVIKIDVEAARKWLSTGAQPTDTAKALLQKAGVYEAGTPAEESAEEALENGASAEESANEANEAAEEVESAEDAAEEA